MKKEYSDEVLKKNLSSEEFHVLREKGTEAPFSGKYVKFNKIGQFVCKVCGNVIFDSSTKFDSGCGWPSFYSAREGSVKLKTDLSHRMIRKEVVCAKCGSHLGHVFNDGPKEKTGKRYCINSVALNFKNRS